jgi:hypothetical protein
MSAVTVPKGELQEISALARARLERNYEVVRSFQY